VSVDQNGRLAQFQIDETGIVPYITGVMNDYELAVQIAQRHNLSGAEGIFKEQFSRLLMAQRIDEAMNMAANSPQGVLRTIETINEFKKLPAQPGQTAPLLAYFSLLLKKGKLNAVESIELVRPVLARGPAGLTHIENWLKEDKLETTEDLGDLLKTQDIKLALSVYVRANVPEKVIGSFLAMGAREPNADVARDQYFAKIFQFAKKVNFNPDYPLLVQQLLRVNPERAKDFALMLIRNTDGPFREHSHHGHDLHAVQ